MNNTISLCRRMGAWGIRSNIISPGLLVITDDKSEWVALIRHTSGDDDQRMGGVLDLAMRANIMAFSVHLSADRKHFTVMPITPESWRRLAHRYGKLMPEREYVDWLYFLRGMNVPEKIRVQPWYQEA